MNVKNADVQKEIYIRIKKQKQVLQSVTFAIHKIWQSLQLIFLKRWKYC